MDTSRAQESFYELEIRCEDCMVEDNISDLCVDCLLDFSECEGCPEIEDAGEFAVGLVYNQIAQIILPSCRYCMDNSRGVHTRKLIPKVAL